MTLILAYSNNNYYHHNAILYWVRGISLVNSNNESLVTTREHAYKIQADEEVLKWAIQYLYTMY